MGVSLANIDLGSLVNGASSLVNSIGNQIRGKIPVDMMELAKLEIQMEQVKNTIPTLLSEVDKAQTLINAEDAKSASFWQSGWRPSVAWMCCLALFYNFIAAPIITIYYPALIKLDVGELITLLFGLLGLGTLRTVERIQKNK
jgi:hypothetical protein